MTELPPEYLAYGPRGIPEDEWLAIRPTVLEIAARAGIPYTSYGRRALSFTTHYVHWAHQTLGTLDIEVIFDPARVEYYTAHVLLSGNAGRNYRPILRDVGRRATTKAPWERRPAAYGYKPLQPPYSRNDLATIRRVAERQKTAGRRRAARALVALGLGAGLDGRWVHKVEAADVLADSDGVLVRVGHPAARVVPILVEWEVAVAGLADDAQAAGQFLVGGRSLDRHRTASLTARFDIPPGCPRISPARLRTTWLVHHLTVGTPVPELTRAAGLLSHRSLSSILPYVPSRPADEARRLLRGLP